MVSFATLGFSFRVALDTVPVFVISPELPRIPAENGCLNPKAAK